jgi:hypothetical protein
MGIRWRTGSRLSSHAEAAGQGHGFFHRPPWLERTIARINEFLTSMGYLKPDSNVTGEKP